jgi:hypothetical protein
MIDMMLMTGSTEYRAFTAQGAAMTAATLSIKPQSQNGSSTVAPIIVNNAAVYAQAQGGHLRELAYQWQSSGYQSKDLSLLATHLFDGNKVIDMAFSRTPQQTVWVVNDKGQLLGLTYLPDQEFAAWHSHSTDGFFESICVVTEGIKDVLYAIVRRTINGVDKRYIEMLTDRTADSLFMDCSLTYSGAPATIISGLDYLEGKTVAVLADGKVQSNKVVTGGSITLSIAASNVSVGLSIEAYIETVPATTQADASFGQGHIKNINKVWARVTGYTGAKAGPDLTRLTTIAPLAYEVDGVTPKKSDGEVRVTVESNWNPDGGVVISQPDPLPITVCDITLEIAIGG